MFVGRYDNPKLEFDYGERDLLSKHKRLLNLPPDPPKETCHWIVKDVMEDGKKTKKTFVVFDD